MTSRLKRKLNDLGVDSSSSKANESFCLIGTPLPPLEKSKDTGEFVPLWKQEVRDEKGRRRLHGAFTGGFSAGYFNTVGSQEGIASGWTPSTFISSRGDRAKAKTARPEDFMDEEDLAELQEGRKLVDEHDEMDFGGTEAELRRRAGVAGDDAEKDPITAALEASLAPAPKDSVGARILKKMGWRVGQGIGPRLTYAQRKAQEAGISDSWKETEGGEEDEEAKKHLYPRQDTPVLLASRKGNFHGLGYVPGMRLEESVGGGREIARDKGPRISAGFGLGALNDADEDDVDIYDAAASRQLRTRMAFDAADEDDSHLIAMGSSSTRSTAGRQQSRVSSTAGTQTFNDGRLVLKGFVLSDMPVAEDRWFPIPDVPNGWTPNPRRVWNQQKNKENEEDGRMDHLPPPKSEPKTHAEWKGSFMSADERGSLLGETPLPSKPRSVFEYISQKDRERLQNIKNAVPRPSPIAAPVPLANAAPPLTPTPSAHTRDEINIPYLHPSVAKAALQGFQPFAADPVKQSRYTAFLNFQSTRGSVVPGAPNAGFDIGPLPDQNVEQFNKELDDYAKAATVFKPLSGAMAGRFRSAAIVEIGPTVVEGLYQPGPSVPQTEGEPTEQEEKEEEDPKISSARLGMYGLLTRETQPWQPARLLCKRFGVKAPEVDTTEAAGAATADFATPTAASRETGQSDAAMVDPGVSTSNSTSAGAITDGLDPKRRDGSRDLANIGLGEDDQQGKDTLTYQRPAMDIFKAIFASDDEDSDDDTAEHDDAPEPKGEPASLSSGVDQNRTQTKIEQVALELTAGDVAIPSYAPGQENSDKVDLTSFKPTFVPRSERESRNEKSKGTKNKDKDKRKKGTSKIALMSFADEETFGPDFSAPQIHREKKEKGRDRKRQKRKGKGRNEDDEDDSMWVEAPAPETVKNLPLDSPSDPLANNYTTTTETSSGGLDANGEAKPPRGRKRAIDFM
ncbi:uncharacterized protein FIBRA_04747 [Fibroporia radiculosa]|uniref:G-patch domain-containing protein n=1 Tax=Fibroporia radiculosa TaxID=599839 RepID=J4G7W2_9APHY|nr:uncharacterized protein FIBRA_04747 [Fibroporia radiculosa]CCM02643.1 predicted protein [Fibroporia radiculosa]